MSLSAAHAAAFRREAPREGRVWTIRDAAGFPAPRDPAGGRAMPFWSKPSRAARVVEAVPAYGGFDVVEIPLTDWLDAWLPGLARDGLLVGLNWAGAHATGHDVPPAQLTEWFAELS